MVSYMKESHGDWLAVEHGSEVAQGSKLFIHFFTFFEYFLNWSVIVEGYPQNLRLGQNMAISKKSTVFVLRLWNLVKIITPWIGNIGQISAELDQKCRFSFTANFYGQSQILGIPLYLLGQFIPNTETTETWTGRLLRFFAKSYLIEIAKYCTNIIWTSSKVI